MQSMAKQPVISPWYLELSSWAYQCECASWTCSKNHTDSASCWVFLEAFHVHCREVPTQGLYSYGTRGRRQERQERQEGRLADMDGFGSGSKKGAYKALLVKGTIDPATCGSKPGCLSGWAGPQDTFERQRRRREPFAEEKTIADLFLRGRLSSYFIV